MQENVLFQSYNYFCTETQKKYFCIFKGCGASLHYKTHFSTTLDSIDITNMHKAKAIQNAFQTVGFLKIKTESSTHRSLQICVPLVPDPNHF